MSRITFKAIVSDGENWRRYQAVYAGRVRKDQIEEVEKMLGCGQLENGFSTYVCMHCGEQEKRAFSCKSRVCSKCGKVHADEWSRKLVGRLLNVTHRHITFTLPDALWGMLERNPTWRKELFPAANETLTKAMRAKPGIVLVLHPYGKDLKVNYHIHALVTEGGETEKGEWRRQSYINYKTLRKVWQYEVITRLRKRAKKGSREAKILQEVYDKYEKEGFYVHAEPKVKNGYGVSRYIGRYLRHPAIANSRIIGYDGEVVTFYYKQREGKQTVRKKKKMGVLEFIHAVVRHIPPKHFKMVRYYGIYAARNGQKVKALLEKIGAMVGYRVGRLSWRKRIQRDFGYDPLRCRSCGGEMALFSITIVIGGRLKTIGGWGWWLARGIIRYSKPPPRRVPEAEKVPETGIVQLRFNFEKEQPEANLHWSQMALL